MGAGEQCREPNFALRQRRPADGGRRVRYPVRRARSGAVQVEPGAQPDQIEPLVLVVGALEPLPEAQRGFLVAALEHGLDQHVQRIEVGLAIADGTARDKLGDASVEGFGRAGRALGVGLDDGRSLLRRPPLMRGDAAASRSLAAARSPAARSTAAVPSLVEKGRAKNGSCCRRSATMLRRAGVPVRAIRSSRASRDSSACNNQKSSTAATVVAVARPPA